MCLLNIFTENSNFSQSDRKKKTGPHQSLLERAWKNRPDGSGKTGERI